MDKYFYLDEQITIKMQTNVAHDGVYGYSVIRVVNGVDNVVFRGRVFLEGQSTKEFDITSIVRSLYITPTFIESLPTSSIQRKSNGLEEFKIAIEEDYEINYSVDRIFVRMFYRYPLLREEMYSGLEYKHDANNTLWIGLQGRYNVSNKGYFRLTPRIPLIGTINYIFAIAGYCTNGLVGNNSLKFSFYEDGVLSPTEVNVAPTSNNFTIIYPLSKLFEALDPNGGEITIWYAGDEVAKVDNCPAKYYLMWQDRAGSFQSQPFDKISTYSESFDREYITNYKGVKRPTTITTSPKIKIQTGYIDEKLYPYYESIFTSPYLLLYDFKEDKSYLVNVTGSDYIEKTFKNQSRQMFNIQLDLEFAKNQNMVY